jgi:hypothetical protein
VWALLLQAGPLDPGYEKLGIIGLLAIAVVTLWRENRDLKRMLMEALLSVEKTPAALEKLREEISRK